MDVDLFKFILISFFGVGFIFIALYKIYNAYLNPQFNKVSIARIDKIDIKIKRLGNKYCVVNINFPTENGSIIIGKFEDMFYPSPYKIGGTIKVRYKSVNPNNFAIQDIKQFYLYCAFIIFGFIILFFGLYKLNLL